MMKKCWNNVNRCCQDCYIAYIQLYSPCIGSHKTLNNYTEKKRKTNKSVVHCILTIFAETLHQATYNRYGFYLNSSQSPFPDAKYFGIKLCRLFFSNVLNRLPVKQLYTLCTKYFTKTATNSKIQRTNVSFAQWTNFYCITQKLEDISFSFWMDEGIKGIQPYWQNMWTQKRQCMSAAAAAAAVHHSDGQRDWQRWRRVG